MEREKEIARLVNVLRKTARLAQQTAWGWADSDDETVAYSIRQYNRVLARLSELDPDVAAVFEPLPDDATLSVVAMACRQLAAYYEEEACAPGGWGGRVYGAAFDADSFKDFWRKSAKDVEDLGEYIRESVEAWARQRREGPSAANDEGQR